MVNFEKMFQNKKQKVVWLLYLLWLTYGLGNFNCPNDTNRCLLANWNVFFNGILIAVVFKTLVTIVIANLLKDKEKKK